MLTANSVAFAGQEDMCPTQGQLDTIASLSDPDAVTRLGDLYRSGPVATINPYLAFAYYSKAVALGSTSARLQVAEMTLTGDGTDKDVPRGLSLLDELAKSGNARALAILGDVYMRGRDTPMNPKQAVDALERASALGDTNALERLAELYHYGRYAPPDFTKAEKYYRAAINAGDNNARVGLGMLLLDRKPSRKADVASALAEFTKAANAGIGRAEVARARYAMTMARSAGDRAQAFAKLSDVAERGNKDAMLEVLAIMRDGFINRNQITLKPDRKKAEDALAKFAAALTPEEFKQEEFLLNASKEPPAALDDLARQFSALAQSVKRGVLRILPRSNARVFAYIAQVQLKSAGAHPGKLEGRMSAAAARELRQFCLARAPRIFCAQPFASNNYGEIIASTVSDRQNMGLPCRRE